MPRRLVLVDFSWCLYRFKHSYSDERFSVELDGKQFHTGQVFGFCRLVNSLCNKKDCEVIFCVDDIPEERNTVHTGYKEGRECDPTVYENVEIIKKVLAVCPLVQFAFGKGKESDDLMAQLFFVNKDRFEEVIVFSGDNDLLQLMPFGAKIARKFEGGDPELVTEDYVKEKYGVESKYLLRYRILVGDPSDKISAVVPRLNREFVKKFIEYWQTHGIEKTKEDFKLHENAQRVFENWGTVVRNIQLMNLQKYRKVENQFPVEMGRPTGDLPLVRKLQLNSYLKFLANNAWI